MKNLKKKKLEDRMESFFLSETVKYLYLLFDEGKGFVYEKLAKFMGAF